MSQLASNDQETTVYSAIKHGEQILEAYNKSDARIDARLLMRHLLRCDEMGLILNRDEILPAHIQESYMYLIVKRAQGAPLQYITKNQEFMGLEFYVDERVLIPRQDTETLVEKLIEIAKAEKFKTAIEIGTGSGCISIALAHYTDLSLTAIDISEDAISVARKNTAHHKLEDRITYLKSDMFTEYKKMPEGVDLIVSNPPYISKEDCKELMQEVRCFEPLLALTDGGNGLYFYQEISREAKAFLKPNGILAYEIGYDQAEAVTAILKQEEFVEIEVIKDLAGKDRVVIARNPF